MRLGAAVRSHGPPENGTLADLSRAGRRASGFAPLDVEPVDVPREHARRSAAELPEVAERDLARHYTRLSQMNYGVDTGIYPLGSCSMKYNPKVAEEVAAMPGFRRLHPLQQLVRVFRTVQQHDHTVAGAADRCQRLVQIP